jgi:hypothetical protein
MSESQRDFVALIAWMRRNRVKQAELGRRLGRPRKYIHRVCHGHLKFIDPAFAVALEKETRGEISAVDYIAYMSNSFERQAA